ncbi:innexin inx2-like protein [Leptotrombidium deliense]|uniref:Innexin n=1 Tax=Leptotrombidium deliense TaxID=299467 RepID=A0A443S186_9ACAR|nr:innexin inx2-like protein [Leptotrombidium deliense]
MYSLFSGLKSLTKPQSTTIDSAVCKVHYRFAVLVLLAFSILVTATQHFGELIKCMPTGGTMPTDMVQAWCLIHSTFTVKSAWNLTIPSEAIYPGISKVPIIPNTNRENTDDLIYHTYYLWVPFVLLLMSVTFYIPRFIWKTHEGGRIKNLVTGLNSAIIHPELKENGINVVVSYFQQNVNNHNEFFFTYVFCESLNFINVVFQIYIMNEFLGGAFMSYGWEVITYTDWSPLIRNDPFRRVFPTLTKCRFRFGASSGDYHIHDTLCLLPINILNQKIFVVIWLLYWFLFFLTLISLVFRLMTIVTPFFRTWITSSHCFPKYRNDLDRIIRSSSVGDWFMLHLLSVNIGRSNFSEFIDKYSATYTLMPCE